VERPVSKLQKAILLEAKRHYQEHGNGPDKRKLPAHLQRPRAKRRTDASTGMAFFFADGKEPIAYQSFTDGPDVTRAIRRQMIMLGLKVDEWRSK
jgi:hypothetical protein